MLGIERQPKSFNPSTRTEFSLFGETDAGDLETRAARLGEVYIVEPMGVLRAVISMFQGYGMGYAETRAKNALVKIARRHGATAAIVRGVGAQYDHFGEPVAAILRADIYH